MHDWEEYGVDWNGIDEAAAFIGYNLAKWGRINVIQTKEKYGEVRVYCAFGGTLYDFFYPHETMFYPTLTKFQQFLDGIFLPEIFQKYQQFIYRRAYKKAIQKWPHLRSEILNGADWSEFLEGL